MTNAFLMITAQFLFYLFVKKYLKETCFSRNVFLFLKNQNLLTPNQSSFRPNDSYINQLLSIAHSIYSDFDHNPSLEVRGIFLDISKALDKVWHEGLLYKIFI